MRILLVAATTGYQVRVFADAAKRMGLDLVLATDRCHVLEDPWGDDAVAVRFEDPSVAMDVLAQRGPFDGIVAVGDHPAFVAAQLAEKLGVPFSPSEAVAAANNKFLARERFKAAGLLTPDYRSLTSDDAAGVRFPCVLKPVALSASRGVIRADNPAQFAEAYHRISRLLHREMEKSIQVEDFIPGREFAFEGLVTEGRLQVLAKFDKPDPLDGPFFEETIYVTPSREARSIQQSIFETAQRAIVALGLTGGPVHAEMRVNDRGVWMLEVAARPIGGLCSSVLRFVDGITLEEVILRHALGEDVSRQRLAPGAHGVMMIPIPEAGVYQDASGVEDAKAVPGIEDVVITAKEGQELLPLPEGSTYLGFIFARGASADAVDRMLRKSHSQLKFEIRTALPIVR
jgi:biotin carboxylase